jgi:PST family polysaccharide transporter
LRICGLQLIVASLGVVQSALLTRRFQFRKLFWINFAPALAPFAVSIPLAMHGAGYWALVGGNLTGSILSTILFWYLGQWRPSWTFNPHLARKMVRFGGFVLLESLLGWLLVYFDNAVVGKIIGMKALGVYSLGFNLAILMIALPLSTITGVALPSFSRLQNDRKSIRDSYLKAMRMVASYAIPAGVGLALVARPAMELIYGQKWEGLGMVLSVLALYSGFGHLWILNSDVFKAIGRPDVILRIYIPVLLIMIPAFIVSARYGLLTFTVTRSCVVLLGAIPHTWFAIRVLDLPRNYLWSTCRAPAISTAIMAICVLFLSFLLGCIPGGIANWASIVAMIGCGVITYAGGLYLIDRGLVETMQALFREIVFERK